MILTKLPPKATNTLHYSTNTSFNSQCYPTPAQNRERTLIGKTGTSIAPYSHQNWKCGDIRLWFWWNSRFRENGLSDVFPIDFISCIADPPFGKTAASPGVISSIPEITLEGFRKVETQWRSWRIWRRYGFGVCVWNMQWGCYVVQRLQHNREQIDIFSPKTNH